ncbi:gamma-glutamylcyclotransferase family protein [Bradyrhizobium valentinum]|uniref:gamma-glutamylcyclotransferase family protein n=1 Tax=Bradyrhizobium valentinum TaxID=1518501 RepID=UPI0007155724|nr:gamma-glutamylcyclotransferase family protein [Bradyrhizobium valentinum]KRR02867.1 hypothetical protein CQ10_42520 [Bradyrhizobium valentinum]KRR03508.1 hypothetical protein CQ10_42435 [Bradyrhizobium valentinum]
MRSMMHRVFVYGTLKSGFFNHRLLGGCEFFGGAVTVPTYKMIETGHKMIETGFPVILPDPEGKPLAGEIYTVDDETLARLDQLEREGNSYDRELIDVTLALAAGERLPTKAFIYVGREDRFGKAFARGPLYETVNERGETGLEGRRMTRRQWQLADGSFQHHSDLICPPDDVGSPG